MPHDGKSFIKSIESTEMWKALGQNFHETGFPRVVSQWQCLLFILDASSLGWQNGGYSDHLFYVRKFSIKMVHEQIYSPI